jgi:hypothetical protein
LDILIAAIVAWAVFDLAVLGRTLTPGATPRRVREPRFTAARRVLLTTLRPAGRVVLHLLLILVVLAAAFLAMGVWSHTLQMLWLNSALLSLASVALLPAGLSASIMADSALLPVVRRPRRDWKRRIFLLTVLVAIPVAVSTLLFSVRRWTPGEAAERAFGPSGQHAGMAAILVFVFFAVSAALFEEILYRQYLLCRVGALARGLGIPRLPALAIATGVSTTLFALSHGGMVEPAHLKYAQTAVLGLALSFAQIRLGLEGAVTVHLVFNLLAPVAVLAVRAVT